MHKCPVAGCTHELPQHILMCRTHWRKVPTQLQQEIYAAWNRGNPTPDYLEARKKAIGVASSTFIGKVRVWEAPKDVQG